MKETYVAKLIKFIIINVLSDAEVQQIACFIEDMKKAIKEYCHILMPPLSKADRLGYGLNVEALSHNFTYNY